MLYKRCSERGCRTSPNRLHPWYFEVERGKKRTRMRVNDFAIPRMPEGERRPFTCKEDIRKFWEPLFMAEVAPGRDPRVLPTRPTRSASGSKMTFAAFLETLQNRHYVANGCRSLPAARSRIKELIASLGARLEELQEVEVIEEFRAEYAEGRETATVNRALEVIRTAINWGLHPQRAIFKSNPFGRLAKSTSTQGHPCGTA